MKILDSPRSGSYAGVTSSRNRYGQYVRTRATPVNPASSFQMAVRARLATSADDFKALTALQRAGWEDLGYQMVRTDSLGQSYTLKGFNAFVSVNSNRLAAGDAKLTDAPLYAPPDPLTSITPTATAASLSIVYTPTPMAAGARVFIYASPMKSAGVSYINDQRLLSVTAAAAASPANVFAAYQARFGTPIVGARIFLAAAIYLNGFVSVPLQTSVIVA